MVVAGAHLNYDRRCFQDTNGGKRDRDKGSGGKTEMVKWQDQNR